MREFCCLFLPQFLQEDDHPERERVAVMLLESEDIKRFQLGDEKASQ